MSLATRCPSCGTIFRVVQDQLKVSEGWVRCGQCHEVFHGIEALFDLDTDPSVAARRAAAARVPAAPPPTRVFAEQRANATIPGPPAARPSAPVTSAPPAPAPTRAAFGAAGLPPNGFPQTGFAPAAEPKPPAPAVPSPIQPVATRGSIAPRFAARLAEESARAQATAQAAPRPDPLFGARTPEPPARVEPSFSPAPVTPPAPIPAPIAEFAAPPPWPVAPLSPPPESVAVDLADEPASVVEPEIEPEAEAEPVAAPPPATMPAPVPAPVATPVPAPAPEAEPVALAAMLAREDAGSTMPSRLLEAQDDEDEARAGPPTLASMLPEDAGEWPPRRGRKRGDAATGTELALVDHSKDPRFLREARSGARWRRPWVRAALSVALLLLLAAAAGQVAWPLRDTLASRWPATRPAWAWLCEQAGCRIEAPRSLASLALDGSSLTRTDTEHVLLFSADLHNRADHDVRMPSFDLAFMDLNGEIVARKVLTPAQIGIHQAALPPDGELHVHARLAVGTLPASGFQADLFYP